MSIRSRTTSLALLSAALPLFAPVWLLGAGQLPADHHFRRPAKRRSVLRHRCARTPARRRAGPALRGLCLRDRAIPGRQAVPALQPQRHRTGQFDDRLAESRWITSKRYFRAAYDFALIGPPAPAPDNIPPARLEALDGKPAAQVRCGAHTLLLYGRDRIRLD